MARDRDFEFDYYEEEDDINSLNKQEEENDIGDEVDYSGSVPEEDRGAGFISNFKDGLSNEKRRHLTAKNLRRNAEDTVDNVRDRSKEGLKSLGRSAQDRVNTGKENLQDLANEKKENALNKITKAKESTVASVKNQVSKIGVAGAKAFGFFTKIIAFLLNPVTLVILCFVVVCLGLYGVYLSYGKNENINNCTSDSSVPGIAGKDTPRTPDGRVDIPKAQQAIASFLTSYDFKAFGGPMTKAQAAGVLGNLMRESGYDNKISERDGKGYSNDEIIGMGGDYHRAVGLIQWDGVRRTALAEFAKEKNKNWDDFDLQLEFLAHEIDNGTYGKTLVKNGWSKDIDEVKAAILWEEHYEISADSIDSRGNMSAGMRVRVETAKEAMQVIGTGGAPATTGFSNANCRNVGSFDNSSIVEMALSISLTEDQIDRSYAVNNPEACRGESPLYGKNTAKYNMPAYYEAVNAVFEDKGTNGFPTYYAGCDRFVSTVLYHTVDTEFPKTDPPEQREYMEASSSWEYVSTNLDDAEPGDVLVTYASDARGQRHIALYIANENGKHMIADASNGGCHSGMYGARIGVYHKWWGTPNPAIDSSGRPYKIFRFVG